MTQPVRAHPKRTNDLTGKRYGMLFVQRQMPSRRGRAQSKTRWLVLCDCGTEFETDGADLYRTDGRARVSCGCMNHRRGEASSAWKGRNRIDGNYWCRIQYSARKRGFSFEITLEDAYALYTGFCALTGTPIELGYGNDASLDRIDSTRGYVEGNVQWVHKTINAMKSNHPEELFVDLCRKVVEHDVKRQAAAA